MVGRRTGFGGRPTGYVDTVNAARTTQRLIFVNDAAGRRADVPDSLVEFERHDIADAEEVLKPLLTDDRCSELLLVAVWGGDGSMRSVARLLVGTRAVMLACPGGSRNHFCRTLEIKDETSIVAALENGVVRAVDVGRAGTEVFLNNVTIGWYTDLVTRRERYERFMPRRFAKVLSLAVQLLRTRRLRVNVDDTPERVWLVWVGNGEYSMSSATLTERASMAQSTLDVRILRAGVRWPKLRALTDLLRGSAESSDHISRQLLPSTVLTTRRSMVRASLDGELEVIPTPVEISIDAQSLRVLVPMTTEPEENGSTESQT